MLARMLIVITGLTLCACGGGEDRAFDGPLTYVRGGGLTGEGRRLTVQPDGSGTFDVNRGLHESRRAIRLTPAERERLAPLVSRLDLGDLDVEETEPMPDAFAYSVSYGGEEVGWQTSQQPEALDPLMHELSRLAEKYGPSP